MLHHADPVCSWQYLWCIVMANNLIILLICSRRKNILCKKWLHMMGVHVSDFQTGTWRKFPWVCVYMHFDKSRGCLFTPHCLNRQADAFINLCVWSMGASLLWIISVCGGRQVLQMEKAPIHYQHLHYHHYHPATAHRQREGRIEAKPVTLINNTGT